MTLLCFSEKLYLSPNNGLSNSKHSYCTLLHNCFQSFFVTTKPIMCVCLVAGCIISFHDGQIANSTQLQEQFTSFITGTNAMPSSYLSLQASSSSFLFLIQPLKSHSITKRKDIQSALKTTLTLRGALAVGAYADISVIDTHY